MTAPAEELTTLTLPEVQALPVVSPAQQTICAVWGMRKSMYFKLLAAGELPVKTFTIGRNRKVLRSDILRALGEQDANGAEAATSTPPAEAHPSTL